MRIKLLELKTYDNDWREATCDEVASFYRYFCDTEKSLNSSEKQRYFNEYHVRGGHVLLDGRVETEEGKKERIFSTTKKTLMYLAIRHGCLRFLIIEHECRSMKIDSYEMAASLKKDGVQIVYDDTSITEEENIKKQKHVDKLCKTMHSF